ncbi:MAG TPA: SET domain-containing protein [Candidatus Nanoarchaeia archaeon]|nr:SET domain-containing protein [Candidatus Nanoarchaeia archaeon]
MDKEKAEVLARLKHTYCRLKPSPLSGVGVFAIRDIPKGIDPFQGIISQKWFAFSLSELKGIDKEVMKMIDDFNVIEDRGVLIPEYALNGMDVSFFPNHSEQPNLKTADGLIFITLRKIKKGEELTVDYATYDSKWKKK